MLFFVNALLWRVMIAAGHDRALLAIAASVLTLNVVLNVALLPAYGFRAASVNVVVTEVFSIAVSAFVLRRREGFLPSLRYGLAIAAAAAGDVRRSPAPARPLGDRAIGLGRGVRGRPARPAGIDPGRAAPDPARAPERPVTTPAGSCELSVVIPARNAADTIGVQLESLARQRFDRPWEVVVVDNGSTDDTRAVAAVLRRPPAEPPNRRRVGAAEHRVRAEPWESRRPAAG